MEPDITSLVDDLLDKAAQTSEFDAIEQLAHPLPVAVICRLLGVPIEDEAQFGAASTILAQGAGPFVTFTGGDPGGVRRAHEGGNVAARVFA